MPGVQVGEQSLVAKLIRHAFIIEDGPGGANYAWAIVDQSVTN
jgi:hypothetical protein